MTLLLASLLLAPLSLAKEDDRLNRWELSALDGTPFTHADLEQGTTLIVVWASWSPRCRDIAARIDRLAQDWGSRIRVVSVAFQEDPESVSKTVNLTGLATPVYLDLSGDFSQQHEVSTLPMLLIFRDGELAFRGKLAASPDAVIQRIVK